MKKEDEKIRVSFWHKGHHIEFAVPLDIEARNDTQEVLKIMKTLGLAVATQLQLAEVI